MNTDTDSSNNIIDHNLYNINYTTKYNNITISNEDIELMLYRDDLTNIFIKDYIIDNETYDFDIFKIMDKNLFYLTQKIISYNNISKNIKTKFLDLLDIGANKFFSKDKSIGLCYFFSINNLHLIHNIIQLYFDTDNNNDNESTIFALFDKLII